MIFEILVTVFKNYVNEKGRCMKNLVAGMAMALMFTFVAAPVMANVQWHLEGSLRFTTFWTERDAGKSRIDDLGGGGRSLKQDSQLDWQTQSNNRVRAYMRSDVLEGFIDVGYNAEANKMTTREYWGRYHFNDKAFITIGQQKQLFSQYISNQAWDGDLGLGATGTAYQSARPKITIGYDGFCFALSSPYNRRSQVDAATSAMDGLGSKNINVYLPQLQASYEYMADVWRVKFAGAYQHLRLQKIANAVGSTSNKTVHSWLLAAEGDVTYGPFYLAIAGTFGQNWSDAGWNDENSNIGSNWNGDYFIQIAGFQWRAKANGSYEFKDTTSGMLALVGAYQLTEALRFEAGTGYRYDDNSHFKQTSRVWNAYLQVAYMITQSFTVTPEIGYIDFGKNAKSGHDQGNLWYAGAKWQMDF